MNASLTMVMPDDMHVHLRQSDMLDLVLADTVKQFARAIVMPNLNTPIISTKLAIEYRNMILNSLGKVKDGLKCFEPLMTLYLTDLTTTDEILKAKESGIVFAVKLYPNSVTTNSHVGVVDIFKNCYKVLDMLQMIKMPLLIHAEVSDSRVDIFDRESVYIDKVIIPLRKKYPELKIVIEHVSTKEGVDYVYSSPNFTAATITPQHMLYNRNIIFSGGLRPHYYCLPILKSELHREYLVKAATSGDKRFFLGTDSAPHDTKAKENSCGCAGCYSSYNAICLYAEIFDKAGCISNLEKFASLNGAYFYDLPINKQTLTIHRNENIVPDKISFKDLNIVPLASGETVQWHI
ncbi:dihydroorotase [Candidatus Kinetoplastibacterium blastocrithidii TCC012E]|uniref:Dihydroorotase n=1 Tax=Candidatus Kinetoplastidibacterium blastocrithidiae TCC012E TaxID=1208922 RepID=M1M142_9PROT|nr:dihydroorotase [Candidatus Kinetoplastibacterium blastocrithidii]AFZ83882.1 dihydroorotase [Candidatus Kinetoplastibacterium blastocrithidii (ex Strigomonas culicis)]AGF50001.1 dihydroorotase [Candidatus Kinetoplastibacterium blastocrithidii TCC012E]